MTAATGQDIEKIRLAAVPALNNGGKIMSMSYYVSGQLTFKKTKEERFTLTELLLRYIAKKKYLEEGEDFPTEEELKDDEKEVEYNELLEDANAFLLREVCDGYDETREGILILDWDNEERGSWVIKGIENLLLFAKENSLTCTGDLAIEFPDNGGEITHWIPKTDLSGFDSYERDEYEVRIASSKVLLHELMRRDAGFACVAEYSHFDETGLTVSLYPYPDAEKGLKERYEAAVQEERDNDPSIVDWNHSELKPDEQHGIIRFFCGGYIEFFIAPVEFGEKGEL